MRPLSISVFIYEKFKVSNINRFKGILTYIWISELFLSENCNYDQYLQAYRPTCAGVVAETVETQRKVLNEILRKTEGGHII
jgi:hypothetical protein